VIKKVVVFIPPPVPPGEAPINMREMIKIKVGREKLPTSTRLNPAVRGVVAWKKEIKILLASGKPFNAFPPSRKRIKTVPKRIKRKVRRSTTREWRERDGFSLLK